MPAIRPELRVTSVAKRQALGRLLIALACSDAHLAAVELAAIRDLFTELGLDQDAVDQLVATFASIGAASPSTANLPPPAPMRNAVALVLSEITLATNTTAPDGPEREAKVADDEPARRELSEVAFLRTEQGVTHEHASEEPIADEPEVSFVIAEPVLNLRRSLQGKDEFAVADARLLARQNELMWGDVSETINDLALELTGELAIDEEEHRVKIVAWVVEELLR